MSRHRHRLRLTCESALRVAEWRLAQQQRRTFASSVRCESKGAEPDVATRRRLVQLSVLWLVVVGLVLSAIELSAWWAIDKRIEVEVGPLVVALGAAVVIVLVVLAFTPWRWKTRRGGP